MTLAVDPTMHTGLVYSLLLKMEPHYCYDEAKSEAMLALVKACNDFRPELGFQFSTFATKYIVRAILADRRKRYQKCRDRRRTHTMTDATQMRVGRRDEPGHLDRQEESLDLILRVESILCKVSPRSAEVLLARAEGMTLDQIAAECGVTRQAVQSWERIAFAEAHKAVGVEGVFSKWSQVEQANAGRRRRMGFPENNKGKPPRREMERY